MVSLLLTDEHKQTRHEVIIFPILSWTEHENYHAQNVKIPTLLLAFNIYEHDEYIIWEYESMTSL